ncbi:multiple epidermal growth factor-like domains protein 10 [Crassostrea angulata]|uniref:multiple epidermal growth factor-like domains protein 10 n=1 Tax=Magallana angulata TaxID=2784310 RepID=UPI0022B153A9|nr:multiple epidermal growth factor-like domains protein 10 [Crassostrea angulata]
MRNKCNEHTNHGYGAVVGTTTEDLTTYKIVSNTIYTIKHTRDILACSPGLSGNNCSIPCRYPSFGHFCQSKCNCNNSSCNAVTGCIGKMLMFSSTNYSLLVGSPTLHPVSKSSPVVESSHFLDNKITTPKLCPVGYLGAECEKTCRHPTYGSGCQMKCNCTEELCDHVNGCKNITIERYNSSEFDKFCSCMKV